MIQTTRHFTFLMVTTLLLSSIVACKDQTATPKKVEEVKAATVEELGQMNRDFAAALTAKDAAAAASLYDEQASILPPNEPIVKGRANIQAYWKGVIDAGIIDGNVHTLDAGSDGNLGYEIGTFTLRFLGEKKDTILEKGKYTEVLKRNTEGKWMSIYGMWSSDEPAPK